MVFELLPKFESNTWLWLFTFKIIPNVLLSKLYLVNSQNQKGNYFFEMYFPPLWATKVFTSYYLYLSHLILSCKLKFIVFNNSMNKLDLIYTLSFKL